MPPHIPEIVLFDANVLAAAIQSKATVNVTANFGHFAPQSLEPSKREAAYPNRHLVRLHNRDPEAIHKVIQEIANDRNKTVAQTIARLAWNAPHFAQHVARPLDIDVPQITPDQWRDNSEASLQSVSYEARPSTPHLPRLASPPPYRRTFHSSNSWLSQS